MAVAGFLCCRAACRSTLLGPCKRKPRLGRRPVTADASPLWDGPARARRGGVFAPVSDTRRLRPADEPPRASSRRAASGTAAGEATTCVLFGPRLAGKASSPCLLIAAPTRPTGRNTPSSRDCAGRGGGPCESGACSKRGRDIACEMQHSILTVVFDNYCDKRQLFVGTL